MKIIKSLIAIVVVISALIFAFVYFRPNSTAKPKTPKKLALIVGIDGVSANFKTPYYLAADDDPQKISKVLIRHAGFQPENARILTRYSLPLPTREVIVQHLEALIREADEDDQVILYFIGHGIRSGNQDFYAPANVIWSDYEQYIRSVISTPEIAEYTKRMKAREVLTFFDMCRTDAANTQRQREIDGQPNSQNQGLGSFPKIEPLFKTANKSATTDKVRATFFSCAANQDSALFNGNNSSVFSYFVRQGIAGDAAAPKDRVTVDSLARYLRPVVFSNARLYTATAQIPTVEIDAGSETQVRDVVLSAKVSPGHNEEMRWNAFPERKERILYGSLLKAYRFYAIGQPRQAVTQLKITTQLSKDSLVPWVEWTQLLKDLGETREAENVIKQLVAKRTPNPDNDYTLGWILQNQGYLHQADELYSRAIRFAPRSAKTYLQRGYLRILRKDPIGAERDYRRALQLSPKLSDSYFQLANLLVSQNKLAPAERLFNTALKLSPNRTDYLLSIGAFFYTKRQNYLKAEGIFRLLVQREPNHPNHYLWLAASLAAQGKMEAARTQAKMARELGLTENPLYQQLGM